MTHYSGGDVVTALIAGIAFCLLVIFVIASIVRGVNTGDLREGCRENGFVDFVRYEGVNYCVGEKDEETGAIVLHPQIKLFILSFQD